MLPYIAAYFGTLISFLILDGIWLGIVAKNSYTSALGSMMRETYPMWPWVTFYLVYCAVIVFLVIYPNMNKHWTHVMFAGAALGLAAYGAYNLTNYAILKDWPLSISIKDWVWGTSVTTLISLSGYYALKMTQ